MKVIFSFAYNGFGTKLPGTILPFKEFLQQQGKIDDGLNNLIRTWIASLQIDLGGVVGASVGGAVEAEADDENSAIDAELNRVTATAIAPLIAAVGRGLETVANLI